MRHALLIEDSPEYQLLVRVALADRFEVTCASNAEEAKEAIAARTYDIILIDVGLPGQDGLSFCLELRQNPKLESTPILFVTGRKDPEALVTGFAAGADDFIHKPFHPDELNARIEARFKRTPGAQPANDHFWKGDLRFSVGRQKAVHIVPDGEREMDLTPNEFKILFHLAKNEGKTLARVDILREIWGENLHVVERTVDKHVCSLRRKMGSLAHYVASVPGQGYTFRLPTEKARASAAV